MRARQIDRAARKVGAHEQRVQKLSNVVSAKVEEHPIVGAVSFPQILLEKLLSPPPELKLTESRAKSNRHQCSKWKFWLLQYLRRMLPLVPRQTSRRPIPSPGNTFRTL